MFWQQVPQVLGRSWDVSVPGGYKADGGVTLAITVRSQLSAPASPSIIHTGHNAPALASSPKGGCLHPLHQALITHSTAVPAVSYLPLCIRSVPEDRSTLLQAELSLAPAFAKQPVSHPSVPKKVVSSCPPPQKTGCYAKIFQKRSFGRENACSRDVPKPQGRVVPGKVISAAEHAISGLVVVLLTLPVVLRCHVGLQHGEVCQVELV